MIAILNDDTKRRNLNIILEIFFIMYSKTNSWNNISEN